MFYRIDDPLETRGAEVFGDATLEVDLLAPEARFVVTGESGRQSCNSLDELAKILPAASGREGRQRIFRLVRQLFSRIEAKYPDSTEGVAQFMEGGAYRVPGHDGIASLTFRYLELPKDAPFPAINLAMDLDYHVRTEPDAPWPLVLEIEEKSRQGVERFRAMFDPYALGDLCFALVRRGPCAFSIRQTDGTMVSYAMTVDRAHNFVLAERAEKRIRLECDKLHWDIVGVLDVLFEDLLYIRHDEQQAISAGFLLDYLLHLEAENAANPEFRRLVRAHSGRRPEFSNRLPFTAKEVVAAGVHAALQRKQYHYLFGESGSRIIRRQVECFKKLASDQPLSDDEFIAWYERNNFGLYDFEGWNYKTGEWQNS